MSRDSGRLSRREVGSGSSSMLAGCFLLLLFSCLLGTAANQRRAEMDDRRTEKVLSFITAYMLGRLLLSSPPKPACPQNSTKWMNACLSHACPSFLLVLSYSPSSFKSVRERERMVCSAENVFQMHRHTRHYRHDGMGM